MSKAVFWFRRDLRLSDNVGLTQALDEADEVIGLFVLDPRLTDATETCEARLAFMYSCLAELDEGLRKPGGRLIVRQGEAEAEISTVLSQSGAQSLYFNHDYTPFGRKRDERIVKNLSAQGYTVKTAKDVVIFEKDELLSGTGTPYTVFTPYKKRWQERISPQVPPRCEPKLENLRLHSAECQALASLAIPPIPPHLEKMWYLPAGEVAGRERLTQWAGVLKEGKPKRPLRIEDYAFQRDLPAVEGTSRLSPFLRFGAISPRQCYRAALNLRENPHTKADSMSGCDTWINELIWRDFYFQIMWHFPKVAKEAFQTKYQKLDWSDNSAHLQAWQEGRTGYPIVDAAMRQLNQTNWMHNRLRMITASFLTKDLLINWQEGERYFWQKLVDGDLPANNGGWQWSASTGTDAQPYFRIFSPLSQSQRFDPQGDFIRRFVPELANVPDKYIHEPSKMTTGMQQHVGCVIGKDYPQPIVDHATARLKALNLYKR